MIISVKIQDETYEKYGRQNTKNPREAVEKAIEQYADVGSGKAIIFTGEELARLQKLVGQLDSSEGLIERVSKVMSVNVGGTPYPLTESQLKGIKDKAAFFGKTPEQFAAEQINKALQNALGV